MYDRTYPLASLHAFNIQTDTVNSELFEQGYFELYNAAYSKNTFLNPDDLTYIRDVKNFENLVPLGVLDYKFNWIDTLAIQNNLISLQNGMFYDVSGRTQNPYVEKRVQMVSPLYDELKPGTVTFSFAPYLTLNNQNLTVQQIQLNFPTVGIATLFANGTASFNFSSVGSYVGTITVTYTNGTNFTNICMITTSTTTGDEQSYSRTMSPQGTQGVEVPPCWTLERFSDPSRLFQGYEETQAYRGKQIMNFYYRFNDPSISCGTGEQNLKKPIIIIDGFDPTSKRDGAYIYNNMLYYNKANGQKPNLAEDLRLQGFDVIIVDIPEYEEGSVTINFPMIGSMTFPRLVRGGGDYIERNAMTLIEVINYVNGKMIDPVHDHITIVGPSMGGQISRYALRWMEKHNMVHNCSLWISMDSPHEGAVLPIGLQSFVKEMSGYNKKAKEMFNNQINVPAARQQLIHHHLANSETPQGSPGFFNRYYDLINGVGWDADGKGWPQLPRRVAVNSGAHNGLEQQGSSCSPAVWLKIRPRNWVRVLFTTTIGTRVESTIKFSPSSSDGRCQVLDLKLKTLLGDVSRPSYATHSGTYGKSLELLPGGWYPGFQELYDI